MYGTAIERFNEWYLMVALSPLFCFSLTVTDVDHLGHKPHAASANPMLTCAFALSTSTRRASILSLGAPAMHGSSSLFLTMVAWC